MIGRSLMAALCIAAGLVILWLGYGLLHRRGDVMAALAGAPLSLDHFGPDWWAMVLMGLGCGLVLLGLPLPGRRAKPHVTFVGAIKPGSGPDTTLAPGPVTDTPVEHAPSSSPPPSFWSLTPSTEISGPCIDPFTQPSPEPDTSEGLPGRSHVEAEAHGLSVQGKPRPAGQFRSKPAPRNDYRTLIVKTPDRRRPV